MDLTVLALIVTALSLALAMILWQAVGPFRKGAGPWLLPGETVILLACVAVIVLAGLLPITLRSMGKAHDFFYTSALYCGPFRFALAYLSAVPVVVGWRKMTQPDSSSALAKWTRGILIAGLSVAFLPVAWYCAIFHIMFGYLPAVVHNPWQVGVPFLAALLVHAAFSRRFVGNRPVSRPQRLRLSLSAPLATVLVLCVMTLPVIILEPRNYDWFADYLAAKYGVAPEDARRLAEMPDLPGPLGNPPDVPPGLALKYLVFGERAVDLSAMND